MSGLIMRLRWMLVRSIMQPILDETAEYTKNLRASAKRVGAPRDWQIGCIEKADGLDALHMQIEQAFGRTSFDTNHRYIRHY